LDVGKDASVTEEIMESVLNHDKEEKKGKVALRGGGEGYVLVTKLSSCTARNRHREGVA
jgi:hypothetical protein